jgi:glycerol-3-phosphate cytidylyltransferase-like family protein
MFYKIKWIVVENDKLWRKIWFPTANINIENNSRNIKKLECCDATYSVNVLMKDKSKITWYILYSWIWTYLNEKKIFETHIFDFNKNIYKKEITIIILWQIRKNKKFDSFDDLKKQIKKDIEYIKYNPNYVLTFWSFDEIHKWHEFYLYSARFYWNRLVTIVWNSKNVKKFKWKIPKYSDEERVKKVRELWMSDIVHLWDTIDPLKWIELYNPKVVCLWYDQVWFSTLLKKYIIKNKLDIKIISISSYKKNIYKSSILKKI